MSLKRLLPRRVRIALRRHGPEALVWRRRVAILGGAVLVGIVALLFADVADRANGLFHAFFARWWWAPLFATPLGFAGIAWLTNRYAPLAKGSGIPQVMAATKNPEDALSTLVAGRTAIAKFILTAGGLLVGASVGREGPTVQIAAAIMGRMHRLLRIPIRSSVYIAGGAAGVAAAFNTPLAGVAFAIEELAAAYEQRMTLLVMAAVLIAGMISLGIAGDYIYFGAMRQTLGVTQAIVAAPVAGIAGGLAGGLFSRLMLAAGTSPIRPMLWLRAHPIAFAAACGCVVAILGVSTALTWGTGYETANGIITGNRVPLWFAPAKFATTLATAVSGLPGGIFAPSLSIGAGIGDLLRGIFPDYPAGAVVLLGMVAYFTGVVRAPLTAVIIISETTASRGLMMPLLAAALIGEFAAQLICKEKLYHGLSQRFLKLTPSAA
ncbi:chloride channel protein [Novosphingobium sp. P6W]|uniref:chloride channel protein n=1 Tax=Novosphingobium sp. P6W TaxID=1609758 RepID=UPI0005C2AA7C|nr:chloride channel protein [Novosphingobium sp. P6W]AXB80603.1 chloride channel protein [Novosphingobium sp. P6W]KIS29358.1 chloride channel protein [Novosphingobium sp. P6W]